MTEECTNVSYRNIVMPMQLKELTVWEGLLYKYMHSTCWTSYHPLLVLYLFFQNKIFVSILYLEVNLSQMLPILQLHKINHHRHHHHLHHRRHHHFFWSFCLFLIFHFFWVYHAVSLLFRFHMLLSSVFLLLRD